MGGRTKVLEAPMRRRAPTYLSFCLLLSLSLPSTAQSPAHKRWRQLRQEQSQPRQEGLVLQRWGKEIQAVEELIRKNQAKKALKKGDQLASDMLRLIESGEGMGEWLGVVGLLRAVAAVESGDQRLGLWHWHIALQMFPELADRDLSVYGETGELLTGHPPRTGLQQPPPEGQIVIPFKMPGVIAPQKIRSPKPEFPPGKREIQEPVIVVVQAIVDKTGRVRDPLILQSEGEFTLVCAALEAMWKWEFTPATLNGEPVDVWYNLSVNFHQKW